MAKKRFQTLLPFALIAIVIAITLVFALRSQSARSDESTYEPGPYGTPEDQIDHTKQFIPSFLVGSPRIPLSSLPPMPNMFGFKPHGIQAPQPTRCAMTVEQWEKIEYLKHRPTPFNEGKN